MSGWTNAEHIQRKEFTQDFSPSDLFYACAEGKIDTLRRLLGQHPQAAVSCADRRGFTCLHWAAVCGHVEVTRVLLQAGASTAATDHKGWTPLHMAADVGRTEVVAMLLHARAFVDARDKDGHTALRKAGLYGYAEIGRLLLQAGASPDELDNSDDEVLLRCFARANKEPDQQAPASQQPRSQGQGHAPRSREQRSSVLVQKAPSSGGLAPRRQSTVGEMLSDVKVTRAADALRDMDPALRQKNVRFGRQGKKEDAHERRVP